MPTKTETQPASNGTVAGVNTTRVLHGVEPTDLLELPTSARNRQATKSGVYDALIEESLESRAIFRITEENPKEAAKILVRIKNRTKALHNRGVDSGREPSGAIVWRVSAGPPKVRGPKGSK